MQYKTIKHRCAGSGAFMMEEACLQRLFFVRIVASTVKETAFCCLFCLTKVLLA